MTYDEAKQELFDKAPSVGSRWEHVKTKRTYYVIGLTIIEATMTPAVVYSGSCSVHYASWVRPLAEFLDGRFERVEP